MRSQLIKFLALLALTGICLLASGCGKRGEFGHTDRRIQSPSMTDPIHSGAAHQDSARYMQYFP